MKKSKRKAGPGRPAKGPFRGNTSNFSTRIAEDTRAALEAEARAKGSNVSQVAQQLIREALSARRERERSNPMQGLCYLIAELGDLTCNFKNADGKPAFDWRTDPFMFDAFKLGILKLMDQIRPAGQARSPIEVEAALANSTVWGPYDTPEARANWTTSILWQYLLVAKPVKAKEMFGPDLSREATGDIEKTAYDMARARKDLQIEGGKS